MADNNDDELRVKVSADTKPFKEGIKEIGKGVENLQNTVNKANTNTSSNVDATVAKVSASLNKAIANIKAQMNNIDLSNSTKTLQGLEKIKESLNGTINNIKTKIESVNGSSININTKTNGTGNALNAAASLAGAGAIGQAGKDMSTSTKEVKNGLKDVSDEIGKAAKSIRNPFDINNISQYKDYVQHLKRDIDDLSNTIDKFSEKQKKINEDASARIRDGYRDGTITPENHYPKATSIGNAARLKIERLKTKCQETVDNIVKDINKIKDFTINPKLDASDLNKCKEKLNDIIATTSGFKINIGADTSKAEEKINEVKKAETKIKGGGGNRWNNYVAGAKKAAQATDNVSKKVNLLGNALKTALGFMGVTAGISFVKNCVEGASDLTEVQNVVDVVFGKSTEQVNNFAEHARDAFGMSTLQAKQFTGTMGAMLQSMGLTDRQTLVMSENMTKLAGDIASFYNISQDQAFEKIRSGISGETKVLAA